MGWRTKKTHPQAMELPTVQRNDEKKHDSIVTVDEISREVVHTLSKDEKLILLALASLSLMAALDGTSISVALPVRYHATHALVLN